VLDENPSPRHLILKFEDLVRCPDVIIRDLYSRFGYPRSRDAEQILSDAVAETRAHQSTHAYNYEKMGYTREQIVREFASIFGRFGFDPRGEMPLEESEEAARNQALQGGA